MEVALVNKKMGYPYQDTQSQLFAKTIAQGSLKKPEGILDFIPRWQSLSKTNNQGPFQAIPVDEMSEPKSDPQNSKQHYGRLFQLNSPNQPEEQKHSVAQQYDQLSLMN